jgi:hypothetical protein
LVAAAAAFGTKGAEGRRRGGLAAINTRARRAAELEGPTGLRKQRGDAAATQQTLAKQYGSHDRDRRRGGDATRATWVSSVAGIC